MLFCSPFLRVTVWPNLFFWACHGKAAHPANMPDEVWSLHPNPALLPSAHIPVQLSSLPEVDVTHRQTLGSDGGIPIRSWNQWGKPWHQSTFLRYVLKRGCWLSLQSWEKLERAYVVFMVFLFSWKRRPLTHQWKSTCTRWCSVGGTKVLENNVELFHVWQSCFFTVG